MRVLSLFDGMSGGHLALDKAGVPVHQYMASEVDPYAIKITQHNYPDTIQVGDVTQFDIDEGTFDLLIGGSPCNDLSRAKVGGLGLEGSKSKLFYDYVRIFKKLKPRYFLLENVTMKQESRDIITELLGVQPVQIDSGIFSAAVRKREYWTNIPIAPLPPGPGPMIEDILRPDMIPVIKHRGELIYKPHKAQCLDANYSKGVDNRGQRTGCIEVGHALLNGHDFLKRVYSPEGKSPTLTAVCGGNQERKIAVDPIHWRKLLPEEYEGAMGIPVGYTACVSASRRYHAIGNGWDINTVAHIFKGLL